MHIRPYGDTRNDGKVQFSFTLPLPAGDKGIERGIADEHHLDGAGLEPCGHRKRIHHVLQQLLAFGVAQDRLRRDRLDRKRERGEDRREAGKNAHRPLLTGLALNRN